MNSRHSFLVLVGTACLTLATSPAFGQAPSETAGNTPPQPSAAQGQEAEPEPAKIDLGVPPPPGPVVQRTYKVHGGFYLAGDFGAGYNNSNFGEGGTTTTSLNGEAFNLNFSVMAGGQVGRGLALGGAVIADISPGASFDNGTSTVGDSTVFNIMVGPMIDAFPNPTDGWRLGATVGFATMGASPRGTALTAFGPGFAAWFGYTPWVSDHLSIGLSARFVGTVGFGADGVDGSTRSINLVASIVYF